jgi:hypothetical protein
VNEEVVEACAVAKAVFFNRASESGAGFFSGVKREFE